jgi:RNA polymerase sigma-70 factor (ECF subfamily)
VYLKNYADTEDVFQEVFIKYLQRDEAFEGAEHEKAWMIRVTINACKDTLKNYFRRNVTSIEELYTQPSTTDDTSNEVLNAILKLDEKYCVVVYLFYFEGYSALEIAAMMKKKENTIYTWLSRGRDALKTKLGGDFFEE